MNEQNLKPQNKRTKSEQRKIAQKGGIASGEARRRKKALNEVCAQICQLQYDSEGEYKDLDELSSVQEMMNKGIALSVAQRIAYEVLMKALKGDMRATEMLMRASEGQKESELVTETKTDSFIDAMRNSVQGVWKDDE